MKLIVVLATLATVCCSTYSQQLFDWERQVDNVAVTEFAVVTNNTVLMSSSDSCLSNTQKYSRSASLHDFEAMGTGMVALKTLGGTRPSCFITPVAHNLDMTLTELKHRGQSEEPVLLEKPNMFYTVKSKMDLKKLKEMSPALYEFCQDADVAELQRTSVNPKLRPIWLLCIWYPFPIYLPIGWIRVLF